MTDPDLRDPAPRHRDDGGFQEALDRLIHEWDRSNPPEAFPAGPLASLAAIGGLDQFVVLTDEAAVDALADALTAIGGADLSLGRVFEGHVNAVQLVHTYGDDAQRAALHRHLAAGRCFGVWNTDHADGVRLVTHERSGLRLAGAKSFATGGGHIDRALITARRDDGIKQLVLVDIGATPDRADNRGWRVRGMKGTVSGRFDFEDVALAPDALIGGPGDYEREPMFTAGAWRFACVQQGAAQALLRHWRDHLVQTGKRDDPVQRLRFGHSVAATRSAAQWVRRAAKAAEARTADAIPLVLMTRGIVEDAALATMEGAARAVGTASFFEDSRIDRITRDLGLYLRQPVPDQARDRAAAAWIDHDHWGERGWW
ncbi:alkylation response protein AidB-like acyl-CoA dehydrogenase [Sphingomonas jejuensis]|uniref:Alkylation response protein AidB-like acyl-CoA dehydrogenase n=1 Tax=Sphingomonas jejuensis TaxID=904715 RepID=A0ABX0XJH2_9SPHN|nr:acyl-CoA dehydrogenase family protein [Sphingomonas jejuensis]NJC33379.1 alkylation response protein AidB-like acyl-CoA dehydrogenase [Sphingomonas jejuensis]